MVPNHARYHLRYTPLTAFILYVFYARLSRNTFKRCITFSAAQYNPYMSTQKHYNNLTAARLCLSGRAVRRAHLRQAAAAGADGRAACGAARSHQPRRGLSEALLRPGQRAGRRGRGRARPRRAGPCSGNARPPPLRRPSRRRRSRRRDAPPSPTPTAEPTSAPTPEPTRRRRRRPPWRPSSRARRSFPTTPCPPASPMTCPSCRSSTPAPWRATPPAASATACTRWRTRSSSTTARILPPGQARTSSLRRRHRGHGWLGRRLRQLPHH